MLLSTRDRSQDIPHNTPDSPFLLPFNTFKRSSIPHNTNNNDNISPTSTAGHQLPQVMSSPSTSSYPNSFDRNDSARRNIGRQILPTRVADHEQKPTQSLNSESGFGSKESLPHNAPTASNAAFLTNADLYSNLATYSFGNPRPSSSSGITYDGDGETDISPLTPVTRRGSTDRTPRPSISSPGNRQLSSQGQKFIKERSSRPRGSHRQPEANDDPMVDSDYKQRRGRARVMSDTASQHTFGGGRGFGSSSASVNNSRSPSRSSDCSAGHEFSSEEELDLDYEPSSLDMYVQGDLGPDDAPDSSRYSQATIGGRRSSLPIAIPGSAGSSSGVTDDASRVREDSLITLRRPSRSLDDDLTSVVIAAGAQSGEGRDLSVEPASEPLSKADFRNLHEHIEQRQQQQQPTPAPAPAAPSNDAYESFDLNYIIGDMGSRRASLAPSYIQQQRELPQRQSRGFRVGGWGAGLQWSGRRPSTATTGTTDDVFIRHAQRFDENYAFASLQWSFTREQADGRGPPASSMSIRSEQSREPVPANIQQTGSGATMVPGTQELWRHEFIGRFKIDRIALISRQGDPTKPPQQRLHIRHIHDPYSKGNKAGGPSSVVHKHSKALAFSIFRHYALLNNRSSSGAGSSNVMAARPSSRTLPSASGGIMLAPKNVQEQYTSTRTTSKLASHGLLGNADGRNNYPRAPPGSSGGRSNASASRREKEKREKEKKEKEKKQREKEEKAKAKAKKAHQKKRDFAESGDSNSTQASIVGTSSLAYSQPDTIDTSSTKAEERVRHNSANQVRRVIVSLPIDQSPTSDEPTESEASSSIISSSIGTRVSLGDSQGSRTAVSDQPGQPGGSLRNDDLYKDSTTVDFYQRSSADGDDSTNEDDDDERAVTVSRTPHAEAFTTLDPDVIEYVRSKSSRIAADGSISWTKRLFGRSAKSNANTPDYPVPVAAVREATYVPPWLTIADRKVQESNEKLIQNLNESFKDVGLVHTLRPSKSSGKSSKRTNNNLFGDIDDDVLYMLLPLWAGETDAASTPPTSAIVTDTIPPVEDRLYLLVWYNPFESRPEAGRSDNPKKKYKSSPNSSLDNKTSKSVYIPQFKVSARLVGYDELLGTGVRLPSAGLSVTGPLWEAMQDAPKSSLRQEHPGDCLLAVCFGREKGIEFLPDGLEKVGLCLPTDDQPYVPESDYQSMVVLERTVFLSAIGRAAAETIWLGCLALTSFGSV